MRQYRLWLDPRSAILSPALCLLLVALLLTAPLSELYLLTLSLFLFPLLALLSAGMAGVLPTLLSLAILSTGAWLRLGPAGGMMVMASLTPVTVCYLACLQLRLHWQRSIAAMLFIYVVSILLSYLWLQRYFGQQLFTRVAQSVVKGLDALPERDLLLHTFYQWGMLSLPGDIAAQPLTEAQVGWTYSQAALQEFYNQVSARVDLWLRALLPTLISAYSIQLCVLGFFVAQYHGCRRAQRLAFRASDDTDAQALCPSLDMPAFSQLFLPRRAGTTLLILSVGFLLARVSGSATLALAGQMMYNVFSALYIIQGLSYVNFLQKKRASRPFVRVITMLALYLLLQAALVFVGLLDQFLDPRRLRGDKNGDNQGGGSV